MAIPENSTNRTFRLDLSYFPWVTEDFNRTLLDKLICLSLAEIVIIGILFFIDFLVISLAVYGLCCLFRSHQAIPIFVVNIFISDVIQICFKPLLHLCTVTVRIELVWYIYSISILANICFMVCISLERYVMIKYPVWYRFHHSVKYSLPLCLVVWTISFIEISIIWILAYKQQFAYAGHLGIIVFLMPYPLVIFCYVGTWRALSHSVSVTPDEKKRILGILALVLFNYTVLFLPYIVHGIIYSVSFKYGQNTGMIFLQAISGILVYLNPLADSLLYVFIRKDANSIFTCLCCKQRRENQVQPVESLHVT